MPADFKTEYRLRTDEELLQFWVERSELLPEAEASLRHEIARRSLTERAAMAQDRRIEDGSIDPESTEESGHRLARPVSAWGPTIAWYWLRELRMRHRTKGGIPLQAKVESTMLTRPLQGRGGGGRRAELCYSFDYQGPRTGRTVRDFLVGDKVGKALVFGHRRGDTITVLVDPNKPDCSYFPSGFGWIQPLLYGLFFSLLALVLLGSAVALAFSFIMNQRQ